MKATKSSRTTSPPTRRTDFDSGAALAPVLARKIADRLALAIAARGRATLAVSGGTTPKAMFEALSREAIDWRRVTITLVDERMAPPDHERSNHRLVSRTLLQNHAAAARFVPLYSEPGDADTVAARAAAAIDAIERPFDVVVLGMGTDGHTASFFPEGTTLATVTDPACPTSVLAIEAPGAGEPRLTLTLPWLVEAGMIALHIEGEAKNAVLAAALEPGPEAELPVRAVLRHTATPVEIFWAP
ncbi:6-phosphogluconolactonase [Hoeflea olei]|uniref:6-phosphogluconolactonase n=1 Tax=Hoeflea olei TaxID=1480615 RepID=A0A1C1YRJ3_9HYPH|nr:6-phosphogluconolactonase [Hoeflea olei]OCW56152.1 6-phosphogluconolactonase [Hoeflea olei]